MHDNLTYAENVRFTSNLRQTTSTKYEITNGITYVYDYE
jgi:hypothetical protein